MTNLQVFFVSMSPIREKRKEKAHLLVDKPLEHIVPQEYFFCLHWEENLESLPEKGILGQKLKNSPKWASTSCLFFPKINQQLI